MGQTIGVAVDEKDPVWVVHRRGSLETYRGQRVQKFVFRGLGPVSRPGQGVVRP